MLAPAILTWIAALARAVQEYFVSPRCIEACLIGCGLLAISVRVFSLAGRRRTASRRWSICPCRF